jgi:uncharacterized protein with HEPN domain
MKKDNNVYLQDILKSIDKINHYVSLVDFNYFKKNSMIQDAVIRQLEIIGEASKRLSIDFLEKYPELEIKKASAMRNLLIHQYDYVDVDIVWKTIKEDLPPFREQILQILK